ncbi:hypothetical protein M405DRAFT_937272 [Rhizopogon salebrosus TDB-379]|nr:hypothetical protein M405DRAFT_937272 [Rhizopogon salebrosus TDB-379]
MSLLRLFTRWKSLRGSAAASNNNPTIQPGRTLFRARSNNPTEDASDAPFMISARICCMLHGMLVTIHILLAICYIFHWEHRVTLPFTPANDDFWSVVLSASLQAFYTIYTAILLFLTQRLSMSTTLVRRVKLTAIHDINGAWLGLGSALSSLWQQIDIPASWWTTSAVAAYFACISVLHVTSSTLLQFQTFNTTTTTSVPTALGWPDDISGLWTANWGAITASLPVVKQLPGLVSAGLSNATIYDTPQIIPTVGNATVNAITITSRCGLIPNVTINQDSTYTYDNLVFHATTPPWSDQIQVLSTAVMGNQSQAIYPPEVALMVSTLLEVDASIQQELSLPITWEYINSSATAQVVVDMQTNGLQNFVPTSLPSTQWETYEWSVYNGSSWQSQLGNALATPVESMYEFFGTGVPGTVSEPSIADEYIMSLVGLNLSAQYSQWMSGAPPVSTFVLSPDKVEGAVAQAVAQLIWIAGRIGTSNGGIDTGNGTANAIQEITALRLNVNLLPLLFAAFASVIMLGLALHVTRAFDASHDSQAVVPGADVLQLLWLGHHSTPVREVLEDVEYPTDADLRHAGMRDVCFAKKICEEGIQLSVMNSPDIFGMSSTIHTLHCSCS